MILQRPAAQLPGNLFRPEGAAGGRHSGQDYGWGSGDQARAAAPGRVIYVYRDGGYNQGWGNRVIVEHAPGVRTTYNHLANGTVVVNVGDTVTAGQLIGTMGTTGKVTAKHLHFELYINGVRVDPEPYFSRHLPGTEGTAAPASVGAHQRTVRADVGGGKPINGRAAASTGSTVTQHLNRGDVGNFKGWTRGEKVTQNGVTSDVWFIGAYRGHYFWAGNFTTQSTDGLTEYPATVATKRYAHLETNWWWYETEGDARAARNGRKWAPAGDHRIDGGTGPYNVYVGALGRNVWVGSSKTNPPVVYR